VNRRQNSALATGRTSTRQSDVRLTCSMPRLILCALILIAALASGAVAASSELRVRSMHAGAYPNLVRAVLAFQGGRLSPGSVFASDPRPFLDGSAAVRVNGARGSTRFIHVDETSIRLDQRGDRVLVRWDAKPRRFKYFGYLFSKDRTRLVLNLWRSAPPTSPSSFGAGRCLAIRRWVVAGGTVTAEGTESGLFEHMFLVRVRDRRGTVLATRGIAARNGRWHTRVAFRVDASQPGTLEAVDTSEGDGSVVCLAEVKVRLHP
jgi:hypothetical protein